MMRLALVAIAMQVAVSLSPGDRAEVTCAGQFGAITSAAGVVSVPCEAVPPPPPPGTVVLGDAMPLPANGAGVVIHQSSGLYVAGPGSAPRLTTDGAFQVDDRAGSVFSGLGCELDSIEVFVGGDYRGGTDGYALVRVYGAGTTQTTIRANTPTAGWAAVSDALSLTSADPVQWRRLAFTGAQRIPTTASMWFAVDWIPSANDPLNMLVVTFNLYDGARPFLNDGYTLRATNGQGVPIASPAFRIFEVCD
jgi:hypothetical protein